MDSAEYLSVALGVGIVIGLFYARRTGWGCGGLVTPGLLAMKAHSPLYFFGAIILGLALSPLLKLLVRRFSLYGRERVGAALLLALCLRLVMGGEPALDSFWIGWIAPGLIAAEAERQGLIMTFAGTLSCALATAMTVSLLAVMRSVF